LLSLDWHNGNRTVLVDQRLTGAILGLTLHTTPAEIYRALIEATAFGARMIVERFEEYGVHVKSVICGGGIAVKNPMAMQIYADVLGRRLRRCTSRSRPMLRRTSDCSGCIGGCTMRLGLRGHGTILRM
jgi:L-ribulokinase